MAALKALSVDKKSAWFEYPDIPGFKVEVSALSRKKLMDLYEKNVKSVSTYDKVKKTYTDERQLDLEAYAKDYSENVIVNWSGLTLGALESLGLFEIGDADPSEEIKFSAEDAADLLQTSSSFDTWVADVTGNLSNFRRKPEERAVPKTGEVA